jgi:hypothetical protein
LLAALLFGAAMLTHASIASPNVTKNGGTFRATLQTDIENVDPARSYYVPEWQYEWMTVACC